MLVAEYELLLQRFGACVVGSNQEQLLPHIQQQLLK
jgi:hypothetical protein